MDKHFLVTISEQKNAWHGVRFVGEFFSNKEILKVSLLYILPRLPTHWEGKRTYETEIEDEQLAEQYKIKGKKALEGAEKQLIRAGVKKENISKKIQIRKFSKMMDIIQEGSIGLHDAVLLGHRGLSWIEEVFDESTSKNILNEKFNFPVWICRKPEKDQKNVLVCVDGSKQSYRIADHVGYILNQETGHTITVMVVNKARSLMKKDPAEIIARAKELLADNGVPKDRIMTKIIDGTSIRKAILREAEEGRFAAVAVGQTGSGRGSLKQLFTGSLCNQLVKDLKNTALWVCN